MLVVSGSRIGCRLSASMVFVVIIISSCCRVWSRVGGG